MAVLQKVSASQNSEPRGAFDFERIFKLRLVVARFGEMDLAKWWNTRGQLGRLGALALKRGFPRTYRFAAARSVFAVAAQRCAEVYQPPGAITLFHLPEALEEELDGRWEGWLDDAPSWTPFFEQLETLKADDLAATLQSLGLVDDEDLAAAKKLRRSAENRAVELPQTFATQRHVALLALAFSKSEPGALAVPYAARGAA